MDKIFVAEIIADPWVLTQCDGARLDYGPLGGYVIVDARPGDLLYELGLRNGDIPVSLNGLPLESDTDALDAFGMLYGATFSYVLEVQRGSTVVDLEYELT